MTAQRDSTPPKDHPRGCGENYIVQLLRYTKCGSPPRMRGKPAVLPVHERVQGITPADAGKTQACGIEGTKPWDHPRGCGENELINCKNGTYDGSPPRMRGKLSASSGSPANHGITPADAGKTTA